MELWDGKIMSRDRSTWTAEQKRIWDQMGKVSRFYARIILTMPWFTKWIMERYMRKELKEQKEREEGMRQAIERDKAREADRRTQSKRRRRKS
jgi:hypothetical protein